MSAFPAGLKISQETFDEVVRENVEDFEMEAAEALSEAISQFRSQGVDLSSIDITGGIGRQEMLDSIESVKEIAFKNDEFDANTGNSVIKYDATEMITRMRGLMSHCDKEQNEHYERNRKMMYRDGLNALHALLVPEHNDELLRLTCNFMNVLCKTDIEQRDFFEPNGSKKCVAIMNSRLSIVKEALEMGEEGLNQMGESTFQVMKSVLSLTKIVCKTENNKNMLARHGMVQVLKEIVTSKPFLSCLEANCTLAHKLVIQQVLYEACSTMRGLCIHDDLRKDMSCAMDNGKTFLNSDGVPQALMQIAGQFLVNEDCAGAALGAAKTLITTEDAVKKMTRYGAMDLPVRILAHAGAPPNLIKFCLGVMRNLCADDNRKNALVNDGTMELMIGLMADNNNSSDMMLMEHGAAVLAMMTLRQPQNARKVVQVGAIDVLVKGMRKLPTAGGFQRQCCLTVRNIAGRCPDLKGSLLDSGCEDVLRNAGKLQQAVDEAYAALRDLECAVTKVKMNEDGNIVPQYEAFGAQKANVKAVWDDVPSENQSGLSNIEERVAANAQAPFPENASNRSDKWEKSNNSNSSVNYRSKTGFDDEAIDHYGNDEDLEKAAVKGGDVESKESNPNRSRTMEEIAAANKAAIGHHHNHDHQHDGQCCDHH